MKEFLELIKSHRSCKNVIIRSATTVTGGYLLVVSYQWGNEVEDNISYLEEAILIVEEQYGPKKGQCRIGWTHKIHEDSSDN